MSPSLSRTTTPASRPHPVPDGPARFLVAQVGARMHYAVPRILEEVGILTRLCTDICAAQGWLKWLRFVPPGLRPAGLRRLLGRIPAGVSARKIRSFGLFGLDYARRSQRARTPEQQIAVHLWAGRRFCELVVREGLQGITGVYTFNNAGLEILREARGMGAHAVLEQTIAPLRLTLRLLSQEQERFPGWEEPSVGHAQAEELCVREEAEWQQADLVICGSEFVRQSVASCGGPGERCQVVPYGVDLRHDGRDAIGTAPSRRNGPLRVLTMGAVGLRKGSPYVLETARRLKGRATFRLVGPVGISGTAAAQLRRETELVGPVPRSEVERHYAWADVFLLPSLCEGSATVTYEALANGLPVVCTPNTGSIVRDGQDGFVVPLRNVEAMAERLLQFEEDRSFLAHAAASARERAVEFSLAAYRRRLVAALTKRCG